MARVISHSSATFTGMSHNKPPFISFAPPKGVQKKVPFIGIWTTVKKTYVLRPSSFFSKDPTTLLT
jgi:hypothetical protein